jgi:hypothetical protein
MPVQLEELVKIQADCIAAYIECESMKTANQERLSNGLSLAYSEEAFLQLIREHGINYNDVITRIRNATY